MRDLAERVEASYGYMVQDFRGRRTAGPKFRARVGSALQTPAEVAPARKPSVDCHAMFERLNAHGISQNEAARRAGISSGHMSQIVNGLRDPSPGEFSDSTHAARRYMRRFRNGIPRTTSRSKSDESVEGTGSRNRNWMIHAFCILAGIRLEIWYCDLQDSEDAFIAPARRFYGILLDRHSEQAYERALVQEFRTRQMAYKTWVIVEVY